MYIKTKILQHIQHGISILIFNVLELPFCGHDFLYLPYVQRAVFVFFSVSPLCLSSMASHLSSITLLLSGCQKPHQHHKTIVFHKQLSQILSTSVAMPSFCHKIHLSYTHTHTHIYILNSNFHSKPRLLLPSIKAARPFHSSSVQEN